MNTNVVFAVAKRDLKSWFGNPTGYMFIILFVVLAVGALLLPEDFWRDNLANLDTLNRWFPAIAVLFCAAITMGTWSSERSNGTQELLFTLPARDSELLLGKYLAAFGVYSTSLLFLLALPIGLFTLGSPDLGQLFANFLGFWLLGAALIASSMVGSQLSENQTLSLIFGGLVAGAVVYSGWLLQQLGLGQFWYVSGPIGQFEDFARGMVSASGLLLFVGLAVAFFHLNLALLARRHHRPGEIEGLHGGLRFAALAVSAVALTVIGVNALPRADGTIERVHSLGSESAALLQKLDVNRPVFVTAFVSEQVPPELVPQKRTLLNLLDQFDRMGGDAVQHRIVPTEAFSPEAADAEKSYSIMGRTMQSRDGGIMSEMNVFLGFVVQCGTEEVVVPFLEPGLPLEYELTRSIRVVAKADRRTVGVLKTDVELYGGFDFQTFQQKPRWQIVEELQLQYKIENVDADKDYAANLDALVVPQPSSLTQEQMERLQRWILDGNAAFLVEDPAPLDAPGTAAGDQKGGARAQMMGGGGGPQKGNFQGLLSALSLAMPVDDVLWDTSYRTFAGGAIRDPELVFVQRAGFATDDVATSGLERAVALFGGHVKFGNKAGWTWKPLLTSHQPRPVVLPSGEPVQVLGWAIDKPKDPPPDQKRFPAELRVMVPTTPGFDAGSFCRSLVDRELSLGGEFFGEDDDLRLLSLQNRVIAYRLVDGAGEGARQEARLRLEIELKADGQGVGALIDGLSNGTINRLQVFEFNPFGGSQQIARRRSHRPRPADYVLAARVKGTPKEGSQKAPHVILCADLDLVGNNFFQIRRAFSDANMRFDNVTFALNCIDSLVGDDSLIELRKRRPKLRSLERVERQQAAFESRWFNEKERAEAEAKFELDEAQKRLDDAVAAVRDDKQLDEQAKEIQIQTIQDNENRKFEGNKARIEGQKQRRIDQARHERDVQKTRLHNGYRIAMLLLAPLPALLMGLFMFARRRARESAIVPQNRMVQGVKS